MRGNFQLDGKDSERLAEKTNGSISDPWGVTETNGPETIETSGQQPSGACVSELTEKAGSLRGSLRSREGVQNTCSFDPPSVGSEHVVESFGEKSVGSVSSAVRKDGTYSIVPGVTTGGSVVGVHLNEVEKDGTYSIVPGGVTGGSSVPGVIAGGSSVPGVITGGSAVPGVITGGSSVGSQSNQVVKDGTYPTVPGVITGGSSVGVQSNTVLKHAPVSPKVLQSFSPECDGCTEVGTSQSFPVSTNSPSLEKPAGRPLKQAIVIELCRFSQIVCSLCQDRFDSYCR